MECCWRIDLLTSEMGLPRRGSRWVFLFVFSLIVAVGELIVLALDYQNNSYQRQFISENTTLVISAAIGFIALASLVGSLVARRVAGQTGQSSRSPTFARIGSFVGRRYKLIIVFWILLLVATLPLSQQLSQVTTSSTGGGQSNSSQSAQADALMAQEFPRP